MPIWYPPTPPQGDGDVYVDSALGYLYEWDVMSESQLPPVYVKRDAHNKRPRVESALSPEHRRPPKSHRRNEASSVYAPRSLFEGPSPALVRMRRDMKLQQKYRSVPPRPPLPAPAQGNKPVITRLPSDQNTLLGWTLLEDKCLLDAVKSQGLPLSLTLANPAHTPNWDLVADMVNNFSRIYRSPRQCRYRYETEILLREEGMTSVESSQKKKKKSHKSGRSMRTAHLYEQDNNLSFTKDVVAKHDNMKSVFGRLNTVPKRRHDPNVKHPNPHHMAFLVECHVNYDQPSNPMEVAAKRVERLAKDKQKSAAPQALPGATEQVVQANRLQQVAVAKVPPSPPLTQAQSTVVASPRPTQRVLQTGGDGVQRAQRIQLNVVKAAGGKPLNQAQLQYCRQQALVRQHILQQRPAAGTQQANIVQQIGVTQQGATGKLTLAPIQVSSPQRPQGSGTVSKQTIARPVTEGEISALLSRKLAQHKSGIQQPVTQIFTTQQQLQSLQGTVSGERSIVTIAGNAGVAVATGSIANITGVTKVPTAGVLTSMGTAAGISGKASMKMATPEQLKSLQCRQQIAALAPRKGQKVTQLSQAQVIVQTPGTHKTLPPGMTMQHLQTVMRQIPQGGARVPRQAIQVVGGSLSQVRSAGGVTTVPASHQVILSQVSATLQARQPGAAGTSATASVRPIIQQQQQQQSSPDQHSKP